MRVYLDHQAATPVLPEVKAAMEPFQREFFGNPSSRHREGFIARDAILKAREQVASFLGAFAPDEIIFTGNGAEAVNLAIKGAAWARASEGRHIVLSSIEHPAVSEPVTWLGAHGYELSIVPVDGNGRIDPAGFAAAFRADTILACVHQSNHDIGTIQEIEKLGEMTSARGITLFVDARASAGWIPCEVEKIRADLLAISPHRFYGPKGVGVLYRHRRARIEPLIHGGEQEGGRRAGTENVAVIVGAGVAAESAQRDLLERARTVQALQRATLNRLRRAIPYLKLNGPEPGEQRHPANLNLSIEFAEGEALGLMLDVRGISVATGSACVARNQRVPPVLAAIGLPEALARGNVIFSFGKDNTEAELDYLVETFTRAVKDLREMSSEWEDFQRGLLRSVLPAPANRDEASS